MELGHFFSALVLTVCVSHLGSVIGDRINSWWQEFTAKNNLLSKPTAGPSINAGGEIVTASAPQQRSDWYAFFHCADLVGREPLPKPSRSSNQEKVRQQQKNVVVKQRHHRARLTLT